MTFGLTVVGSLDGKRRIKSGRRILKMESLMNTAIFMREETSNNYAILKGHVSIFTLYYCSRITSDVAHLLVPSSIHSSTSRK
ncbi:hypothetical protein RO3G_01431 [Rhizopus delemar RA 99-880]|uniref:Uncharacterized protein n=1 Tax=Rhizopus delemar (strain RA 99-880 / ATCC MYA-4621 / FGSC 9543 / NRRL 43880) TaxID=246409 RepID=I1BKJ7_RHIO9|nr:hypothetical protein RO3G_01431 [Rhizopus delemar RA 99-880]|eukprot:EIE76727.1 hypothetical protein RO3G_01431 [Rhizopus delemar RA 99-880]